MAVEDPCTSVTHGDSPGSAVHGGCGATENREPSDPQLSSDGEADHRPGESPTIPRVGQCPHATPDPGTKGAAVINPVKVIMSPWSVSRSRGLESHVTALSRIVWPWRLGWLVPLVALLAALDLISTYLLLEHSGKSYAYESGPLAAWALRQGGYNWLYVVNALGVGGLCLVAVAAQRLYLRLGLPGFARAAYVLALVPYAVATIAAVANNFLLTVI